MTAQEGEIASIPKACPECSNEGSLRQILYGLPAGPPDPEVYRLGGCCVTGSDPDFVCIQCGWKGSQGEKGSHIRE